MHVNDDYQSIFPPDVHAVMDHGKRDVSAFPIATGAYYKVDYAPRHRHLALQEHPGADVVHGGRLRFRLRRRLRPRRDGRHRHVADHHIAPGKKQWTWGCGDFGRAWDRQLTDDDGPYIELMCGAFTDNQPDFSWLMPFESRRFTQRFYPIQKIGPADFANAEAAVSLRTRGDRVRAGVSPARVLDAATVRLTAGHCTLVSRVMDLAPGAPWVEELALPKGADATRVSLSIMDAEGREVVSWHTGPVPPQAPIVVATEPALPGDVTSVDELHRIGTHLEQYRHATRPPEPYWEEALRRDPHDVRCLAALARREIQRGQFAEANAGFALPQRPRWHATRTHVTARSPSTSASPCVTSIGGTKRTMCWPRLRGAARGERRP